MKNEIVITRPISIQSKGKIISRGYKAFYTREFHGKVREFRVIDRLPDMAVFDKTQYVNNIWQRVGAVTCQDGYTYIYKVSE